MNKETNLRSYRAISMRELQKMSAAAIQALPHAVPIKNGRETVAILMPMRRTSPESLGKVLDDITDFWANATPEELAWRDALAAERGIDWD